MNHLFTDEAWDDYTYWQNADKRILKKINNLLEQIRRTPYEGTGKPEPLKYELQGCWSRRINKKHRVVYEVLLDQVNIVSCRYHY